MLLHFFRLKQETFILQTEQNAQTSAFTLEQVKEFQCGQKNYLTKETTPQTLAKAVNCGSCRAIE